MPRIENMNFITASYGDFIFQRLNFSIDDHDFIIIFSEVVILGNGETSNFSNDELGFIIPKNSYEIKFDRAENFHNEHYFELPAEEYSQLNYQSLMRLGDALNIIISNHYNKFIPQVYLSVAVNTRLKLFYDRLCEKRNFNIPVEIKKNIGEGGRGYAIKTPRFYDTSAKNRGNETCQSRFCRC
ncbi:hypothetical protein [Yersinia massiliensis]|uniref:hypothetical protein n=1 Tax=Yersinia massiliensis TaxID=419257 RepID=UPI001CFE5D33|nr:hypothetical protein [Yersinia massiliensis]MCB5308385.1 hypothetical protein [Yersinia massiliensis]